MLGPTGTLLKKGGKRKGLATCCKPWKMDVVPKAPKNWCMSGDVLRQVYPFLAFGQQENVDNFLDNTPTGNTKHAGREPFGLPKVGWGETQQAARVPRAACAG